MSSITDNVSVLCVDLALQGDVLSSLDQFATSIGRPQPLLCGILLNCCKEQRKGLVSLLSLDNQYKSLMPLDEIRKDLFMNVWSCRVLCHMHLNLMTFSLPMLSDIT